MNEDIPYTPRQHEAIHPIRPSAVSAEKAPRRPFGLGEVVRLVSGGPAMTVEAVTQAEAGWKVRCRWFPGRYDSQSDDFDAKILEHAEREDERLFGYDTGVEF